ncbi:MAG: hypothetical protein LBQ09_03790, partial [Acidobacteriaceae bacterium]|nr:hypothetical protein [Acidobacteriaceae bacterium]
MRKRWLRAWIVRIGSVLGAVLAVLLGAALAVVSWNGRPTSPPPQTIIEPPGRGESASSISEHDATLINGRRVTPVGRVLRTQSYSWGLALSPDGRYAALLSAARLELVALAESAAPQPIVSFDRKTPDIGTGAYMGVAFSPDSTRVYFGSANDGQIKVLDLSTRQVVATIDINGDGYDDSFVGDFALSR